jgi:hypothetical protein
MSDDNNNKMQNMCTLETWENLRKCPKTPNIPHPHGNLNHKVDDDATSLTKVCEDTHKSPT